MFTRKRFSLSSTVMWLALWCVAPGAITSAQAQTYDRFSNSLMYGVADPGAIYVPDANTYIGAVAQPLEEGFVLYGSPNLEDLFRPESIKFNFRTSDKVANFKDPMNPKAPKEYFCSHGTPSFVLWKGKLYMTYQTNAPKDKDFPPNETANPCGVLVDPQNPNSFLAGPNYVLENNNPADPFCKIDRTDGQKCWHAVIYNLNHPIGGRALSFLKRNTDTNNPELWAVWTTESVRIMRMDDPGTPAMDPDHPGQKRDPQNAILISNAASTVLPKGPNAALTPWETKNFRPYEYRHIEGDGTNEAPQGLVVKDNGGKEHVYITYSANTWKQGDYLVGIVEFTGSPSDPLDKNPMFVDPSQAGKPGATRYSPAWSKSDKPFFDSPAPAAAYSDPTVYGARHYTPSDRLPPPLPKQAAPQVCGVGSNTFVKSPDLSEIWIVYGGRANCTYARSNQGGPQDSVDDFYLVAPQGMVRSLRIQRVTLTDGVPSMQAPWADGSMRLRPAGESPSKPPLQMLVPQSTTLEVPAADSRVFAAGFTSDDAGGAGPDGVAGQLTSNKIGSYTMIFYEGSAIKLTGPVGNNCPSPTKAQDVGSCGKIEITVDGDSTKTVTRDIGGLSGTTDIFDSTQGYASALGLSFGQHTLTVRVVQNPNSPVSDESRVSLAKVTVTK